MLQLVTEKRQIVANDVENAVRGSAPIRHNSEYPKRGASPSGQDALRNNRQNALIVAKENFSRPQYRETEADLAFRECLRRENHGA